MYKIDVIVIMLLLETKINPLIHRVVQRFRSAVRIWYGTPILA
jgi:hypothetical protein